MTLGRQPVSGHSTYDGGIGVLGTRTVLTRPDERRAMSVVDCIGKRKYVLTLTERCIALHCLALLHEHSNAFPFTLQAAMSCRQVLGSHRRSTAVCPRCALTGFCAVFYAVRDLKDLQ